MTVWRGVPGRIAVLVVAASLGLAAGCGEPGPAEDAPERPVLVPSDGSEFASAAPARLTRRVLQAADAAPDTAFGRLVDDLSEPGGYFDTDNLVSNEASYLHPLGALRRLGVQGGAYIGVGPDQNFAYIAAIRPEVAFIVDIRRDNVLQHLLFKTIFELAETRVEYMSLLLGRALPENPRDWWDASSEEVVEYVREARGGLGSPEAQVALDAVLALVGEQGVELGEADLATITHFHEEFIRFGLQHRFSSFGAQPRPEYPTYEELLTETDLEGREGSFIATREAYTWLRDMQAEGRIVPVVGDFAGPRALRGIGDEIRSRGLVVSAFYTSNVEFYVWSGASIGAYLGNLRRLPSDERSMIIRSYFPTTAGLHPEAVEGYVVTQTLQPLRLLQEAGIENRIRSYYELVTYGTIPLTQEEP